MTGHRVNMNTFFSIISISLQDKLQVLKKRCTKKHNPLLITFVSDDGKAIPVTKYQNSDT